MSNKIQNINENKLRYFYKAKKFSEFRQLIGHGVNLNHVYNNGNVLIMEILKNYAKIEKSENLKFFDELLEKGANVDSFDMNPGLLSLAILARCDMDYIVKLLNNNVNINSFGVYRRINVYGQNNQGNISKYTYGPPIFDAVYINKYFRKKEYFNLLLDNDPDLQMCNAEGKPILCYLIEELEILRENATYISSLTNKLIEKGADPYQRDNLGNNALHILSRFPKFCESHPDLFDVLCQNKTNDIDSCNIDGNTPIMIAAINNNPCAIKALIKNGADLNKNNIVGNNPLILAAQNKAVNSFDCLIDQNINLLYINKRNKNNLIHELIDAKINNMYYFNKIFAKSPSLFYMKNSNNKSPIEILKNSKYKK